MNTITGLAGTLALIGTITSGVYFFEDTYAKKEEAAKHVTKEQIAATFGQTQQYIQDLRIEQLTTRLEFYDEVSKTRPLTEFEKRRKKLDERALEKNYELKEGLH